MHHGNPEEIKNIVEYAVIVREQGSKDNRYGNNGRDVGKEEADPEEGLEFDEWSVKQEGNDKGDEQHWNGGIDPDNEGVPNRLPKFRIRHQVAEVVQSVIRHFTDAVPFLEGKI